MAGDRDRLRDQVLSGPGWRLHRIWGTAGTETATGEEEHLRTAIKNASVPPVRGLLAADERTDHIARPTVTTEPAALDSTPDRTLPHTAAQVARLPGWVDPGDPGSAYAMRPAITLIATVEGPVHISLIHQRLRDAWNIGRIGSRIRANIDEAIDTARLVREGSFVRVSRQPVTVRTPTNECARTVEQIHDDELSPALIGLVHDSGGAARGQVGKNPFGDPQHGFGAFLDQFHVTVGPAQHVGIVARRGVEAEGLAHDVRDAFRPRSRPGRGAGLRRCGHVPSSTLRFAKWARDSAHSLSVGSRYSSLGRSLRRRAM